MKIHEYQAKAILAKFGVPVPRGEVVLRKDEARAAAQRLRNSRRCRESADSCGWTRQGRRRETGKFPRRSRDARRAHAGNEARDAADRRGRANRAAASRRGGTRHQARALLERFGRSRVSDAGVHGQRGGRNGNRGSGEGSSRSDSARGDSSRDGIAAVPRAQAGVRAGARS